MSEEPDPDKSLPEDAAIEAAHPLNTGRDDLYAEAMRLVSAKYSKSALVLMVNWLLLERDVMKARAEAVERQPSGSFDNFWELRKWTLPVEDPRLLAEAMWNLLSPVSGIHSPVSADPQSEIRNPKSAPSV